MVSDGLFNHNSDGTRTGNNSPDDNNQESCNMNRSFMLPAETEPWTDYLTEEDNGYGLNVTINLNIYQSTNLKIKP